ncbi:pirin family protein [Synechococcus sp. R55.3]|uniref:pirin family protein n=1 Tax=Synechococcus sp. R55.3 TaxID=2969647 RepID=UPI0039C28378
MLTLRKREERGHVKLSWLDTYHSFSFGEYYDPRYMGFRALRVINDDRIRPSAGFPTHGHRDMEIVTYVLKGILEHKDSLGTGSVIRPGEIQRMTAGTGIQHSEYNHSADEEVHLLQIWILPEQENLDPSYEQKATGLAEHPNEFCLIASRDGRQGSVIVHQDVNLYAGLIEPGHTICQYLDEKRYGWLQVARGNVTLNGLFLREGDGVAIAEESELNLFSEKGAEVLLFDLA